MLSMTGWTKGQCNHRGCKPVSPPKRTLIAKDNQTGVVLSCMWDHVIMWSCDHRSFAAFNDKRLFYHFFFKVKEIFLLEFSKRDIIFVGERKWLYCTRQRHYLKCASEVYEVPAGFVSYGIKYLPSGYSKPITFFKPQTIYLSLTLTLNPKVKTCLRLVEHHSLTTETWRQ